MKFRVFLTRDAERDLKDICDYLAENDSPAAADHVAARIERSIKSLSTFPNRGNYPKELESLGAREYREIFFKPYRIIYKVLQREVYVLLIADGRRDMQTLLARRLLSE